MMSNQNLDKPAPEEARRITGARIHAARLLQRIPKLQDAADAMGVKGATLWGVESGLRTPSAPILSKVLEVLKVSVEFVLGQEPKSDGEEEAAELAKILLMPGYEILTREVKSDLSGRLRELRAKAKFGNATEAARFFGWGRASYVNYEGNKEKMSLDRAIFFALDLLGRIHELEKSGTIAPGTAIDLGEFLLGKKSDRPKTAASERPVESHADDQLLRTPMPIKDKSPETSRSSMLALEQERSPEPEREPDRRWLRVSRDHGGVVELAVLEARNGRLEATDTVVLPVSMLKNLKPGATGLFVMQLHEREWAIVDHFGDRGEQLVYDGRRARPSKDHERTQTTDPVRYDGGDPVALGRVRYSLSIEARP